MFLPLKFENYYIQLLGFNLNRLDKFSFNFKI